MKLRVISLLTLLLAVFSLQARVYVLAVGVSYQNGQNANLPQSSRVAQQFADAMKVQTPDVTLLTSRYCTVENVRAKLAEIVKKAGKEDRIVFFHAGHGYDGGYALVDGTMSYDELAKTLAKSPANLKLVFLGGCHSGSAKKAGITKYGDQAWMTATRPEEVGLEYNAVPYAFGESVAKGIRGKADFNGDYDVTVEELFKYVYNDILNKNKRLNPTEKGNRVVHHPTLIAPEPLRSRVVIRHKK